MKPVIEIHSLSKKYKKGQEHSYLTLRDSLTDIFKFRNTSKSSSLSKNEFWAVKNLSITIQEGEVLGIIGRNGAGKSTLLKILSRITPPTKGTVVLRGRLGSLLEVGTGFHQELTGRENIYLNGSILGMTQKEIAEKFNEITGFAEIGDFLDTQVKHYSSGMYMRLAFAIASNLNPEIMIVDEVLAVGDTNFQKKCLGKMGEIAKNGRTILFVSHNLNAIRNLCTRVILMEKGKIVADGDPEKVIAKYLDESENGHHRIRYQENLKKSLPFQVLYADLSANEISKRKYESAEPITLNIKLKLSKEYSGLYGYLTIMNQEGVIILESDSLDTYGNPMGNLKKGIYDFRLPFPQRMLTPGKYHVYLNFAYGTGSVYSNPYPGVIGSFELYDTQTNRGNGRRGFIGSIINWEKIKL